MLRTGPTALNPATAGHLPLVRRRTIPRCRKRPRSITLTPARFTNPACTRTTIRSISGTPGRNRTCDLSLRRRVLYPLSYWGLVFKEFRVSRLLIDGSHGRLCPDGKTAAS